MKQSFEYPSFLYDSSETDGHVEIIMDYVISWCLRFSETKYNESRPILNHYCKYMLAKIIQIDISQIEAVNTVEVWKEWERIDLAVEVEICNCGGTPEHHAILIENKYFSNTRKVLDSDRNYRNQLEVYKKKFDDYYKNDAPQYKLHYCLITCIDRGDDKFSQYDNVEDFGFQLISAKELIDPSKEKQRTESDIFNEFWFESD